LSRAALFLVTALIILVIIGAIIYYGYTHAGKETAAPASTSTAQVSTTTQKASMSTPTRQAQGVIKIGTLRGGVSSLDVILAEHLDTKNGFKVKPLYFTTTLNLANAIAHGDIDVAIIPAEFVAKLREQGSNVVILAVDFYQNQAIVVQGKENITSIEQLRGKKVAVFRPTGTFAMLLAYMKAIYGVDAQQFFHIVPAPPPQIVQAFARGDVDAAVIWEPFVSKLVADYGGKILVTYQELWRKWSGHVGGNGVMIVYAARAKWAREHPGLVEKLLTARSQAAKLWDENETLAEKILEKNYGLSPEAARLCWKRLRMETAKTLDEQLVKNILAVWELAREGGYISSSPESLAKDAFWQAGQ